MNNTYIRKIDILDLITFNLRHIKAIIIVAIIGMLLSGGYRLNEFRIALNNAEYVNSVQAAEKIRASCLIYVNGKDYSNSASERVVDMSSIVKSYDVVNTALDEAGVEADYKNIFNWIYTTTVANNMVEVCIDLSLVPNVTTDQACQVLDVMIRETKKVVTEFAGEDYISFIEEVHEGSYYLDRKTGTDDINVEVDTISELIGVARYCVLGAAAGFVVTVFCLCVFYLLSTVLRTEEDMCHGFGNVVIGKMFGRDKESMRKAKTVITHDGNHKAVNLISITDKEDRDAAADALAASLSVNGSRAVLVNACRNSNNAHGKGMYAYVTGKCGIKDIISKSEGYDQIDRLDEDETIDMFAHENFKKLIDELKSEYDYVVVNSPAYKKSADGMLISAVCDKTVVIAGRNVVKEDDALELTKNLFANEVNYAGIVLTK